MILSDVIGQVRIGVNDTDIPYRYSDTDLVGYLDQLLKLILQLRPDLFATVSSFTCAGGVLQVLPSDGYRLMEVLGVQGGNALPEVNREALDLALPSWRNAIPGTAVNWMRHPRESTRFFVYPPAPVSPAQILDVEYVRIPATYTGATTTTPISELSDAYLQTLVSGVIWLVESIDDEHVNSGRAQQFMQQFMQGLGQGQQAKTIVDSESGGVASQQMTPPATMRV